jgi:hypothetical protein
MFSNVLVGVDGRQGGRDAIALARQLAPPQASMTLAHVYGSDWMLGRGAAWPALSNARSRTRSSSGSETTRRWMPS